MGVPIVQDAFNGRDRDFEEFLGQRRAMFAAGDLLQPSPNRGPGVFTCEIVGDHVLTLDTDQTQQQRDRDTGAIFAGSAMYERRAIGSTDFTDEFEESEIGIVDHHPIKASKVFGRGSTRAQRTQQRQVDDPSCLRIERMNIFGLIRRPQVDHKPGRPRDRSRNRVPGGRHCTAQHHVVFDDGAVGCRHTADVSQVGNVFGHEQILVRLADTRCWRHCRENFGPRNYTGAMANSRKVATTAALGSGAVVTTLFGLLFGEGALARRAIGTSDMRPPSANGMYGDESVGKPISCLILGDSAAVGYGMTSADATPPGMVGLGLAHVLDCPVQITSLAIVGAQTSDLDAQIDLGLKVKPDLALIVVGTNDVTHRVRPAESARRLEAAVRRLGDAGCDVVVATCPDLGTIAPLPEPLRSVARLWSRRLAARQAMAALAGGGRAVSLGGLLGPIFASRADVMFGEDRFHPSETGYAHMISVVIPSLAACIRDKNTNAAYATAGAASPRDESPRIMLPVAVAATQAAQHAGTELVQTGRWATLRRRRRTYDTAPKANA